MKLSEFKYHLPAELIAQAPARQRDRSRLLVVDRDSGQLEHSVFADLGKYLPEDSLLVLNDTRVIPARILAVKAKSGGKLEILLIHRDVSGNHPDIWEVLIKGKVRPGALIQAGDNLSAEVIDKLDNGHFLVKFSYKGNWEEVLQSVGHVPLPPYIKGARPDDSQRYQTVYARNPGAIAAPTAGLHFTPQLLEQLRQTGIEIAWITLNVGPGTFSPIRAEDLREHQMGAEYYSIPQSSVDLIQKAKKTRRKIISVGTTTTRTLESASDENGNIRTPAAWTKIFIYPGHKFRVADCLLTNFHLPESTPLVMTCAFANKPLIMRAYQEAIRQKYRFYSYGDAMLIL